MQRLLAQQQVEVPLRTLQRELAPHRAAKRAAELATVRFETPPGYQLQIDFGEKWVDLASTRTKIYVFVALLGYSRRIYVRASLSQRQDDWREGLAGAFRAFGGVPQRILIDRAGALVVGQERESGTARIHPAFAAFCKDWGVEVSACRPYSARAPRARPNRAPVTSSATPSPACRPSASPRAKLEVGESGLRQAVAEHGRAQQQAVWK